MGACGDSEQECDNGGPNHGTTYITTPMHSPRIALIIIALLTASEGRTADFESVEWLCATRGEGLTKPSKPLISIDGYTLLTRPAEFAAVCGAVAKRRLGAELKPALMEIPKDTAAYRAVCKKRPCRLIAPPRPLGAVCMTTGDCIPGSQCMYGTCEWPGPCASRSTVETSAVITYEYDHLLREKLTSRRSNDGSVMTHRSAWTDKPLTQTIETRVADRAKPLSLEEVVYTERYRIVGLRGLDPETRKQQRYERFDWDKAGDCHISGTTIFGASEKEVVGRSITTCNSAGRTLSRTAVSAGGELQYKRRYTYDTAGHLVSLENDYPGHGKDGAPLKVRVEYMRGDDGLIIGVRADTGRDGTYENVESYDMSCWQVKNGRVERRK